MFNRKLHNNNSNTKVTHKGFRAKFTVEKDHYLAVISAMMLDKYGISGYSEGLACKLQAIMSNYVKPMERRMIDAILKNATKIFGQ